MRCFTIFFIFSIWAFLFKSECLSPEFFTEIYNALPTDIYFFEAYEKSKIIYNTQNFQLREMEITGVKNQKGKTRVNVRTYQSFSEEEDEIIQLKLFKAKYLHENYPKFFEEIYDCFEFFQNEIKHYVIISELLDGYLTADFRNPVYANFYMSNEILRMIVLKQIAKGLAILHKENLVHANLTPSNIMVNVANNFREVKLVNFLWFKGTEEYVSDGDYTHFDYLMESVCRKSDFLEKYNPKQDIWSFGQTIFSLENPSTNPFGQWNFKTIRTISDFEKAISVMTDEQWIKDSGFYYCFIESEGKKCFTNLMTELLQFTRESRTITAESIADQISKLLDKGEQLATATQRSLPGFFRRIIRRARDMLPIV